MRISDFATEAIRQSGYIPGDPLLVGCFRAIPAGGYIRRVIQSARLAPLKCANCFGSFAGKLEIVRWTEHESG